MSPRSAHQLVEQKKLMPSAAKGCHGITWHISPPLLFAGLHVHTDKFPATGSETRVKQSPIAHSAYVCVGITEMCIACVRFLYLSANFTAVQVAWVSTQGSRWRKRKERAEQERQHG